MYSKVIDLVYGIESILTCKMTRYGFRETDRQLACYQWLHGTIYQTSQKYLNKRGSNS